MHSRLPIEAHGADHLLQQRDTSCHPKRSQCLTAKFGVILTWLLLLKIVELTWDLKQSRSDVDEGNFHPKGDEGRRCVVASVRAFLYLGALPSNGKKTLPSTDM
jgi:hypothetical protein